MWSLKDILWVSTVPDPWNGGFSFHATFPIEMGSMFDHVFPKSYAFGIRRLLTVQVATTSESLHTMWPSLIKCKYSTEMKQACDNLLADTRIQEFTNPSSRVNHFQHSQWYLNQETQLWQRFQKSLFGIPKENVKSRCLAALAVAQGLWGKCETEQCHLALGFVFTQHKWKLGHDSYEWTTSSTNDRKYQKDENDERERFSNIIPSQGIVTKAWRQRDTKLATQ